MNHAAECEALAAETAEATRKHCRFQRIHFLTRR